jgi:hypothetical protein
MQNSGLVDWVVVIGCRRRLRPGRVLCRVLSHNYLPLLYRYLPRRSAQSLTHHNLTSPASQCCGHFSTDIPATALLLYLHHCKKAVRKQHHLSSALPCLAVDRPHTQSTTAPVAPKHQSSQSFAHHWRRRHQRTPGSSLCQASSSSSAQPAHQLAVLHAYYRARVVTGGSRSRYGFTSAACLLAVTTAPPTTARPQSHAAPRPSADLLFCRRYQQ